MPTFTRLFFPGMQLRRRLISFMTQEMNKTVMEDQGQEGQDKQSSFRRPALSNDEAVENSQGLRQKTEEHPFSLNNPVKVGISF